ncbi:MAG: site-specific integrase [Balneola sp.]
MKPSYTFISRPDKKNKYSQIPIYLRVIYNRKKSIYNTGIKIDSKHWNEGKSEVRKSHPTSKTYNQRLETLFRRAQKIGFRLEEDNRVSAKRIVEELKGVNPLNFLEYIESFCIRLEKSGSVRRSKQTKVLKNKLLKFLDSNELMFSDIDNAFLEDFEIFLRTEIGNAQNTINKDFERFKMVFEDAKLRKIHRKNPFDDYKIPTRQYSKKEALNFEQIQEIERLDLVENESLYNTRNYFLFSFYNAGIRFGDLCRLKWTNIQDGRLKYLMSKSTHTKQPKWKNIKLNDQSLRILGHYIKTNNDSEYIFPLVNTERDLENKVVFDMEKSGKNVKVNRDLKEIGRLADIDINITFHIARHTFARHAANMGMNVYAISNALAHSDLKTTQTYLNSFNESLLDKEMENLF